MRRKPRFIRRFSSKLLCLRNDARIYIYINIRVYTFGRGFDDIQSRPSRYIVLHVRSFEFFVRTVSLFLFFFRENSRFRRKRVGTIFSFRTSMARLANRKIQTVFPIRTFFRSHDFSGFVSAQLQLCEIFHVPIYRFIFKNPLPRFKIPSIHFGTMERKG